MKRTLLALLALTALTACNRSGRELVSFPVDGIDGVAVLGEITPIQSTDWGFADSIDKVEAIRDLAVYAKVGAPRDVFYGGATATFMSNGGSYCLMVDPEGTAWVPSVSLDDQDPIYAWPDNNLDDGDIELTAGLSAYYTGSPDISMGDFRQTYEDSLGNEVQVEFNDCVQRGYFDQEAVGAGRGRPEYCEIDTSLHPNREYTIALQTWSLPIDDDVLSYALAVFEIPEGEENASTPCAYVLQALDAGSLERECILTNESCSPADEAAGACNQREIEYAAAEYAFCSGLTTVLDDQDLPVEATQSDYCDCGWDLRPENDACQRLEGCNPLGEHGFSLDIDYDSGIAALVEWSYASETDQTCDTEHKRTEGIELRAMRHCGDK
jgi:hypothetical protein